jgi:hypothetical protein
MACSGTALAFSLINEESNSALVVGPYVAYVEAVFSLNFIFHGGMEVCDNILHLSH